MTKVFTVDDLQASITPSAFHKLFSPRVTSVDSKRLTLALTVTMSSSLERQPGTGHWHGGAVAGVIDIAGCYALAMACDGVPPPTINFRTDYLRPGTTNDLTATALVRRAGRSTGVVDVDVYDNADQLIAVGRGCYSLGGRFTSN